MKCKKQSNPKGKKVKTSALSNNRVDLIDVKTASFLQIIAILKCWQTELSHSISLYRIILLGCPPDDQLSGDIECLISDYEGYAKELNRIVVELPKSRKHPEAMSCLTNGLRVLSCEKQIINNKCHDMREDYVPTKLWRPYASRIYYDAINMSGVIFGFSNIADRLDVLFVPPKEHIPVGQPPHAGNKKCHYIFSKNFCSLSRSGCKKPIVLISRTAKTASVLGALFDSSIKMEWIVWSELKKSVGFSRDNPREFFSNHKSVIPLLDIKQKAGNLPDWNIRFKPNLNFTVE
jgi:hypothetical protein